MANTRRSFRRSTPQRGTTWEGATFQFLALTNLAPQFAVIASETVLEQFPNPTLIRQRGRILAYANAGGATLDSVIGLGMYYANSAALAAGIGSLQLPLRDFASDWIWTDRIPLSDNSGSIDQIRPTTAAARIDIDGKAMRKAEPDQTLIIVADIIDFGATLLNTNVSISLRLLFKK